MSKRICEFRFRKKTACSNVLRMVPPGGRRMPEQFAVAARSGADRGRQGPPVRPQDTTLILLASRHGLGRRAMRESSRSLSSR